MANQNQNPNQIELTVVTTSGTWTDTYNIHQHLQHVIDRVFNKLQITPAPNEEWQLKYGETLLNPSQTIQQAGLPDKARLTLAQKEGGGGGWTRR